MTLSWNVETVMYVKVLVNPRNSYWATLTSVGLEHMTCAVDRPLLYRLNYEARPEQVVGGYRGNCGNVNLKITMNVIVQTLTLNKVKDGQMYFSYRF